MRILLRNNRKGFSLVEVAIAIIVMGLIVGATLKGKELIHTAKINGVMEQVHAFKIATQVFMDRYGIIPGHFDNMDDVFNVSIANAMNTETITSNDDAKRFWSNLLSSNLLNAELVNGFPVSKIGGYYSVSSNLTGLDGVWIVLNLIPDNTKFKGVLSQEEAYIIDKKNDTGNPITGEIRTFRVVSGQLESIGDKYNLNQKNKDCVMAFRIW